MNDRERKQDKFRGCLVGLAIGDALGAPVELWTAEQIKENYGRVEGYVQSDRVELGHWTDDTTMSLAVARGIIAANGKIEDIFPLIAQEHLADWISNPNSGYGRTTRNALQSLAAGKSCYESGDDSGSGNGVAMRIAPFALWLIHFPLIRYGDWGICCDPAFDPSFSSPQFTLNNSSLLANARAISYSMSFGRITHTNPYSLIAGVLQAAIVMEFFDIFYCFNLDFDKKYLYARSFAMWAEIFEQFYCLMPIEHKLSLKIKSGYDYEVQRIKENIVMWNESKEAFSAITSCPFAWLTALKYAESFKDGVLAAVNAGGDADTTASMVGAILGALHGLEKIKKTGWCEGLWRYDEIVALADQLFEVSVR